MATQKSSASPRRSSRKQPDALRLLKDDHDKVKGLFEKFHGSRSDDKKGELAQTICQELTVHTQIEDEIFYPAVREAIDDEDIMNESVVEHASARELIEQIQKMSPDDELFDAKVVVLGEYVNHHIREEQNQMFPQVRKTDLDLNALAEQLRTRKKELMAEMGIDEDASRASQGSSGARASA
jgi:hemerythrin superfamily protein